MGIMKKFKMIVPPKKEWSQNWTEKQVKDIFEIALTIRNEEPMDAKSLWRSAEGEFASNRYESRV